VVDDGNDKPQVQVVYKGEVKRYYPEEISAMILGKMKQISDLLQAFNLSMRKSVKNG
jgi:L1 cell adhesion molecule like protein